MSPARDGARRSLEVARAAWREIGLYAPERTPVVVDLSDNTNGWGIPPAAAGALAAAATEGIAARYPSPYGEELKEAAARRLGVAPGEIVTGCGSDDVLDSAIRAFGAPGARLALAAPTFSMIPVFARLNGVETVEVSLRADLSVDVGALLAAEADIVYLCSPNNPTGTLVSPDALERVVAESRGVVIVDEAYADFAGTTLAARAPALGNVLVTRTLSKAYGLAGLRVGYGVGAAPLVREVEKSRGPYSVSALAERAAVAALTEDAAWVEEHVALAIEARERLAARLRAMGLAPLPSAANFVLVPVPAPGALEVARRMRAGGVAVRPFAALPVVGDALRISVGPAAMVDRALAALEGALGAGARA